MAGNRSSLSSGSVALWEPDITPPDDWLIPGILYQDKVSTFAPFPDVDDRDGREADRLRHLLGAIYVPLSLFEALNPHDGRSLLQQLQERLPVWQRHGWRLAEHQPDTISRAWVERSSGWAARQQRFRREASRLPAERTAAVEVLREAQAALDALSANVALMQERVEAVREETATQRFEDRSRRREMLADLLAERTRLVGLGSRWDRGDDANRAIRELEAQIKEKSPEASPATLRFDAARKMLAEAIAERAPAKAAVERAERTLAGVETRIRFARQLARAPWESDVSRDRWLDPRQLAVHLPFGLDTIGAGKVHGAVFEFLATEGGMWVSQNPRAMYAGTLLGPDWMVADILRITGQWHCERTDGWVPMSARIPAASDLGYVASSDEDLVTLAIRFLLPVPVHATLAQVRDFRLAHEDELQDLREGLAFALPPFESADDLRDLIHVVRMSLAEPLAEVERALELDRSLGLSHVAGALLHRAGRGAKTAVSGLIAAGIATPLLGNTISAAAMEATIGGGTALTVAALSAGAVRSAVESHREPSDGPYQYVYQVGRQLGPLRAPRAL